jgi:hypothetical protein
MVKRRGFKYFLAVCGFLALFVAGYTATSVVTSCDAQAQACCAGITGTECMGAFTGVTPGLAALFVADILPGLLYATLSVSVYYAAIMAEFMVYVMEEVGDVTNHWLKWWDTFWFYNFSPALQDMTRQLVVLDADQARAIGAINDMLVRNRTISQRSARESKSHAAARPGENVCVAGTLAGGMVQADTFTRVYNTAAATEKLGRTGNQQGTPAASGKAAEMLARYNNYVARYCDPNENAGAAGCTTRAPFAGQDRDVTGMIFQQSTIDLKDPDVKRSIDDLITNIAEPVVRDPMPAGVFESAHGQQYVLENEANKAQRQVIYDTLYHVVARRAPSSDLFPYVAAVHAAAGVPISMRRPARSGAREMAEGRGGLFGIKPARAQDAPPMPMDEEEPVPLPPSKNEVMEAVATEQPATGTASVTQVDEPENAQRQAVVQTGLRTRQLSDLLDLMDRYSLIVAGQVGNELKDSDSNDDASSEVPLR